MARAGVREAAPPEDRLHELVTDAESMATALGHSPLFACGGHGHARRGGEGGNLRFFIRAHDQATHAPWRPYCSLHSGGGILWAPRRPRRLSKLISGGEVGGRVGRVLNG
eukprot:scaffold17068_cov49-Phaeocystis_antarctica.AAC.4